MYEFLDWRVQDVMSRPVSISPDTTLAEAERILESESFDALPVVDTAERLVGLFSSFDLLRAFDFPEDVILPPFDEIMKRPVSSVMTRDVGTVCPRTPLTRVVQKIADARRRSFPVVDGDRLVGVVARVDVMNALRRAGAGERP